MLSTLLKIRFRSIVLPIFIIVNLIILAYPGVQPSATAKAPRLSEKSVFGVQSEASARVPRLSDESVDFLTKTGEALAEVVEAVKPSIVNISTSRTEQMDSPVSPFFNDPFFKKFFGDQYRRRDTPKKRKSMSLGSGVIVSSDGLILTNNHVIKDADKITVVLSDKNEFIGKVIGKDPKTDLAVIKIDAKDLPTLAMGDSDALKVGEFVLAVGNPYGLNQTITLGIVSAVGRANVGIADYEDFIQTDAAINPGNSGGALVNARGELVGINTAIFSTTGGYQGIGFAIPSNMAKTVMNSLIESGKVVRGWLGVSIQSITPELAEQFKLEKDVGTLVADVVENSPAEKAGLMRGDVIIEFNGREVDEPYNLRNIVASTSPGDTVPMTVIREGEFLSLMVTIDELPSDDQKAAPVTYENVLKGVSVQSLTPDIYRKLNLPEKIRGVVVSNVEVGSLAEARLQPGDVILEINRKAIASIEDYESIVSEIKPESDVLLLVFRRGSTIFVTINKE